MEKDFSTRVNDCLASCKMYSVVYGYHTTMSISQKTDIVQLCVYTNDPCNIPKPNFECVITYQLLSDNTLALTIVF